MKTDARAVVKIEQKQSGKENERILGEAKYPQGEVL